MLILLRWRSLRCAITKAKDRVCRAKGTPFTCATKAHFTLRVRYPPEELSIRLGSYQARKRRKRHAGDRYREALRQKASKGGRASPQAATRVKPEQVPIGLPWMPTLRKGGEGCHARCSDRTRPSGPPGYWAQHVDKGKVRNVGDLAGRHR